jgi:3-(3-hydroxy-phenyl)propionate hydroxylase
MAEPQLRPRENPTFDYVRSPDQDGANVARHPVVIVGAGPIGLSMAIDLAQQGVPAVVLDDDDTVSVGSRAICYAKRTLEIWNRLGVAQPMVDLGITWKVGRVRFDERLVYSFDLQPQAGHRMPAFVNLQQYHMEEILVARAAELDLIDLRWKNGVTGLDPQSDHVTLAIDTPDGAYRLEANSVIAADGARSALRTLMGLDFGGRVFDDQFLITDIIMKADFPSERWFWFDPPFNRGQSALLHRQAENVWRLDFQIGKDADPERETRMENLIPRIRAMLGDDLEFDIEWASVYTFKCRRLDSFRHGRVIFTGDAAHQVSPFGARGANSGVQDTDNLAWKLALVTQGLAPDSLLDSYDAERGPAADENLMNSTRSTDFITPKSAISRTFRDAVLDLAERYPFARPLVNSGRLSLPSSYERSTLNTPDQDTFESGPPPGAPAVDAPVSEGVWLLDQLPGRFTGLYFGSTDGAPTETEIASIPVSIHIADPNGEAAKRYDAQPGTIYLLRPDQHVAARWRTYDKSKFEAAIRRATGHGL